MAFRTMLCETGVMPEQDESQAPPFLGTWRRVYAGVLSYLAVLLGLLYLLTRAFRY